ncbi:MAG: OsmC family protein [Phycisphaerales bacterium]
MQTMTKATQSKPATAPTPRTINGIDVAALQGCIDAIKTDPAKGNTSWRVQSRWMGGTRSDHHVEGCTLGGEFVQRPFTIKVDEPLELVGTNQYANPQEYLLAALNSCMMVGYSAVAALMGIQLTKLEIETTGDIDLRGFLGLSDQVPPGYRQLEQTVRIDGSGTAAQFAQLHDTIRATSPNFFNITRAIQTNSRLIVG